MTRSKKGRPGGIYRGAVRVLASNRFFYIILFVLVLEATWYALSFQPTINDESRHLGNIFFYSQHINPFVNQQDKKWDNLGEVTRSGSYMYYYLMSWPYKFVRSLTENQSAQIIFLRFINTVFVVVGIIYFRRALKLLGHLPVSAINFLLLFLVLTPAFALLAGTVNYDNLALLIFAYLLFLALKIMNAKHVSFLDISLFASAGFFMSVVKWTSLSLFIPLSLFLLVFMYKQHGRQIFEKLKLSALSLSRIQLACVVACLVVSAGLFIERPVSNILQYKKLDPQCEQVLGEKRCESFADYVVYKKIHQNKPASFEPYDPARYVVNVWTPKMVTSSTNLIERSSTQLSVAVATYVIFAFIAVLVVMLNLRKILADKKHVLIFAVLVGYLLILVLDEYLAYVKYGVPAAVRARYLIPILPIAGYFIALSVLMLFGRFKRTLLVAGTVIILVLSQGAGITTQLLTAPEGLYWPNDGVLMFNQETKKLINPYILGG